MYVENPKTKGSGIVCCIPQTGRCPMECPECFFQSGRGYLAEADLPNMPSWADIDLWQVVRVNDGNDSNVDKEKVIRDTRQYSRRFYNTSVWRGIEDFEEPVVLTVNGGSNVDASYYTCPDPVPDNLMFVRVLTNAWNIESIVRPAVKEYTAAGVPVVLTFMAYHDESSISIPGYYIHRKRTSNEYWAIETFAWRDIMRSFLSNPLVHSCGTEGVSSACKHCGNCLREYAATKERMVCDE